MTRDAFDQWLARSPRPPLVMGVLNLTPDSFSDGGRFVDLTAAVAQVREMISAGADLIDIGGESTRPGSSPVPPPEQIRRVLPVMDELRGVPIALSIDTTRAEVALAAIDAGAAMVNDVSAGLDDPQMLPLVARRGVAIVLMHMHGTPATMQDNPHYTDVVAEVRRFLIDRVIAAVAAGIRGEKILLDVGIGFGKTIDHNLALLRHTRQLVDAFDGKPLVIGASRKGFIGTITGEPRPERRLFGTAAAVAWCIANGASIVRVHDVGPMYQVVRMIRAIQSGWSEKE